MEFLSMDPATRELTLNTCAIPKPKENDVLIRVVYSGICGTDLHILDVKNFFLWITKINDWYLKGSFPAKTDSPLILGHEFVGTVQAVGSEVKTFKIGDKVAVNPNNGCNKCNFCHRGTYHYCKEGGLNSTIGIFRNGGWATHASVHESQVLF